MAAIEFITDNGPACACAPNLGYGLYGYRVEKYQLDRNEAPYVTVHTTCGCCARRDLFALRYVPTSAREIADAHRHNAMTVAHARG